MKQPRSLSPSCVLVAVILLSACQAEDIDESARPPESSTAPAGGTENDAITLTAIAPDSLRSPVARAALQAMPGARVLHVNARGTPTIIHGELGRIDHVGDQLEAAAQHLRSALESIAPAFALAAADFRLTRLFSDELGYQHAKYRRYHHGLAVVDTALIVHVDDAGVIYAANGTLGEAGEISPTPSVEAAAAVSEAAHTARDTSLDYAQPRLVFVLDPQAVWMHLAWEIPETGRSAGGVPVANLVYVDAHDGALVKRSSLVLTARNRWIYDNSKDGLGGPYLTLANRTMVETSTSCSTWAECHVFNDFGDIYGYFNNAFSRDSYDDAGGVIKGEVHCWNETQGGNTAAMVFSPNGSYDPVAVFGDGFVDDTGTLTALDIVAHEFTHALSWEEASLAYRYESGALAESISDIMAARIECYTNGNCTYDTTYAIGEDSPRGAFRWLYQPTLNCPDPEAPPGPTETPRCGRDHTDLMYTCDTADSSNDYCWVHHNAGIANLQFKMLASGGYHPRAVAPNNDVTRIGWWAVALWYRALTVYMTSAESFNAARIHTIAAANDYFGVGSTEAWATHYAWANVGVPN